jgi:RNA-splicing ligase RtcB
LQPLGDGPIRFLIHTGSRNESGLVDSLIDQPHAFDAEFARVVAWAADNRARVHQTIESVFGALNLVLDLPHNTYEQLGDGSVIIRKGSVHVRSGDLTIIPSHMSGQAVLVRATDQVSSILHSMSHGTGRTIARGDAKTLADLFDFDALRQRVLIPQSVDNASLRTDGPFAYRDLDDCLALIDGYVDEVMRFDVVAYMGHL